MNLLLALILSASAAPARRQYIQYTSPFQTFTIERTPTKLVFTDRKQTVSFRIKPCNKAVLDEFWTEMEKTIREFPRCAAKTATRVEMNGTRFLPMGGRASRRLKSTPKLIPHLQMKEADACLSRLS